MNYREFAYSLAKMLNEDLPLSFTVYNDNDDTLSIRVELPEDFSFYNLLPKPTYIGLDDYKDKFEVYIRVGYDGYNNFGRVSKPEEVFKEIESFLYDRFGNIIDRISDLDYTFSQELKDFLEKNSIDVFIRKQGTPDLEIQHSHFPFTYILDFSEYNGDVLIVLTEEEYDLDGNTLNEVELYRSALNRENQKKVFSDILRILRKEL